MRTKSHDHVDQPQFNLLTCWSTLRQWCYAMFPEMTEDVMDIQDRKSKIVNHKKKKRNKTVTVVALPLVCTHPTTRTSKVVDTQPDCYLQG